MGLLFRGAVPCFIIDGVVLLAFRFWRSSFLHCDLATIVVMTVSRNLPPLPRLLSFGPLTLFGVGSALLSFVVSYWPASLAGVSFAVWAQMPLCNHRLHTFPSWMRLCLLLILVLTRQQWQRPKLSSYRNASRQSSSRNLLFLLWLLALSMTLLGTFIGPRQPIVGPPLYISLLHLLHCSPGPGPGSRLLAHWQEP